MLKEPITPHTHQSERPIILIPSAEIPSKESTEPPIWAMRSSYVQPVLVAGGTPLILPQIKSLDELNPIIDSVGGILLGGGPDIHAEIYGAVSEPTTEPPDHARDRSELLIVRWALEHKVPLFGICRGAQIINIAAGGTLYQNIPTEVELSIDHRVEPITYATLAHHGHLVKIDPQSRLSAIILHKEIWMNSMHHQSIKQIGRGLKAVAFSADGVIEAIESVDPNHWIIGLQSHPEACVNHDNWANHLFNEFVRAAQNYRDIHSNTEKSAIFNTEDIHQPTSEVS